MRALRSLFSVLLLSASPALSVGTFSPPVHADEVAPELESSDLRRKAEAELRRLFMALPQNDQRRLVGMYVAFDPDLGDPMAQVACDDDGDYVIVLSDAMLRLVAHVARAASHDEANGNRKVEEYAAFIARSQLPGRRLLPPPPGFYIADKAAGTYEERSSEAVGFVLARELSHFRAGDLVCPKPTATKESGDDVWTSAEQRKATEAARSVYPGHQVERDTEATARILDVGRSEKGAFALLRFFIQYETESRVASSRFIPSYVMQHPSSGVRLAVVKQTAEARASGARSSGRE
jgi:hypothetical protein